MWSVSAPTAICRAASVCLKKEDNFKWDFLFSSSYAHAHSIAAAPQLVAAAARRAARRRAAAAKKAVDVRLRCSVVNGHSVARAAAPASAAAAARRRRCRAVCLLSEHFNLCKWKILSWCVGRPDKGLGGQPAARSPILDLHAINISKRQEDTHTQTHNKCSVPDRY